MQAGGKSQGQTRPASEVPAAKDHGSKPVKEENKAVDDAPNEIDNPQGGEGHGTGPNKKSGSK